MAKVRRGRPALLPPPHPKTPVAVSDSVRVLDAYTAFQAFQAAKPGSGGPVPLASFPFETLHGNYKVWIGKSGTPWEGWVGLDEPGKPLQIAPWGTTALAGLGCEVLPADRATKSLCPPLAPDDR